MDEPIDKQIAALARRQRGFVTRPQVMKFGLSEKAIRHRVHVARLIPVYSGVYAVGHLPMLPQDRAMGALLACGKGAVLSHSSAAALWRIFRSWDMPFEVTAPTLRRRPGIRVHRAALTNADIRREAGVPVTSPARTLLDNAPRMTEKTLRRRVNDLRRTGHLRLPALAELLKRVPRHPGAARLRPFVEVVRGPTRSEFEDAFIAFIDRFGLPQPQINVNVAGREVDAWFPEQRVIVELDGWNFHSDRATFESDRQGDAAALALGIVTIRITWERLTRQPEQEAERLWRILRARSAA